MRRHSWLLLAGLAIAADPAFGQQVQTPKPPTEEGFFRPSADPVLTGFPLPKSTSPPTPAEAAPLTPDAAATQLDARERLERELDRAQRENAQAQAEAAQQPKPLVVSPLDGTAPVVSPLDGTAPIVSPLGR